MNPTVRRAALRSSGSPLRHVLTVLLATALSLTGLVALSTATAPSAAAAAGSITGTVTASGTGTPLAGMTVVAFCEEFGDWDWCEETTSETDGSYALDLPDGTYRVGAYSEDNQYATAFHGGTDRSNATDLVPPASGIDLQMARNASVQGRVGQGLLNLPLADIGVCLFEEVTYDDESSWECVSFASTAANGTYTVWAPPGIYRLGFFSDDNQWRETYYGGTATVEAGSDLIVSADSVTGVNVKMVRNGKVTGTVRDAANGAAVPFAEVRAHELVQDGEDSSWDTTFSTTANANGSYSLFLADGTYRLEFDNGCDEISCTQTYTPEFWNDQADVESADDVTIVNSSTVSGVNASLARNGRITGTVLEEDGGEAIPGAEVSALQEVTQEYDGETFTYGEPMSWATADETGAYELFVPDGTYRVSFDDSCAETCADLFQTEYWEESDDVEDADDVVVAGDGAVAGRNGTLTRNGSITGNVTAESDGAPLEGIDVLALQEVTEEYDGEAVTYWAPVGFSWTDQDGDYSLPVPSGSYRVGFMDSCWDGEECRYLTEFHDDVASPEEGTDVTVVGSDATPGIDAALAEGSAVSGTVIDADGAPVPDAEVTAYVDDDGEWTPVTTTWTDEDGSYGLLLPDGSYRVGFADPTEDAFTEEFYDNARTIEEADTIVVDGADVTEIDATVGLVVPVENLVRPTVVDEDPQVGELVFAHVGVWSPMPDSAEVRWFHSGSEEPIGTGNAVVVPAEALGETLTVEVRVSKADRADAVALSEPSAEVVAGTLANTVKPVVRGPLAAGATVEALEGAWSAAPDSYTYRWFQSGKDEPIGTAKKLVIPEEAIGKTLTVEVTGRKAGFTDGVATSAPTAAVTAAPSPLENTSPPRVTGTVQVGRTLTVDPGSWSEEPTRFVYQWWVNGTVIPGVTGDTYTVPPSLAGKLIQVMVTAGTDNTIGTAWTAVTPRVAPGTIVVPARPTLTGKAKVGKKLRVVAARAATAGATLRVQWLANGKAIRGADRAKLKLGKKYRGKKIRAQVSYTLPGYTTVVWRTAKVKVRK